MQRLDDPQKLCELMAQDNSYKILVVDDNAPTLYSTCRVLKSAGFEAIGASSGTQAIEFARQAPDLIVLDVDLPDLNGFEICRRLRERPETQRTPVIYLSATFVSQYDKVEGLEAGADGYLTHPVEPPVLIATVKAFLRAREAEVALRQSEAKFRAIFDLSAHGICLLGEDLTILEANPALCELLRSSRDELVGAKLSQLVPETESVHLQPLTEGLSERDMFRGTLPVQRGDGSVVQLDIHASIYSQPRISLATVIDATERLSIEAEREQLLSSERAARASAEHANRLKDDFLATLSHELRTPLSAIVGWAQLFQMQACSPAEIVDGAHAIERNARIQTQLIADLLDISRITSGKMQLEMHRVMPAELLNAALDSARISAQEKHITVTRDLDPLAGPIVVDPSRIQQVVWNLVNNAVKFTPDGGTVRVTLRQIDSVIEIIVSDTGQGIAAKFLPHIFERFRQEDASTRRGHGGLGLGLSIVKQLVEMHGGTVRGESEGEGRGATFIVRLPINTTSTAALRSPDKNYPQVSMGDLSGGLANLSGSRILVVEDDDDTRSLIVRILMECDAETIAVASVDEALQIMEPFRPTLLISDIGIPLRDGYDLIHAVRERGISREQLPAIALTAFARSEDRDRALGAGFQAHLSKPVDPMLLSKTAAELSVHRSHK